MMYFPVISNLEDLKMVLFLLLVFSPYILFGCGVVTTGGYLLTKILTKGRRKLKGLKYCGMVCWGLVLIWQLYLFAVTLANL